MEKIKTGKYILGVTTLIALCFMLSCKRDTSTYVKSNVAKITAFKFVAVDSIPGLGAAKFVVEELNDTGLIYNTDSIKYGTPLNKVRPYFNYYSYPSAVAIKWGKDSIKWLSTYAGSTDTLDFTTGKPMTVTVISEDQSKRKVYKFKVVAHQADPDLMRWTEQDNEVYSPAANDEQRLLVFGSNLWLFVSNGTNIESMYSVNDGATWVPATVNQPKAECKVNNIFVLGDKMHYVDGKDLYTSLDGESWSVETATIDVDTLTYLFSWADRAVLAGHRTDKSKCIIILQDGQLIDKNIKLSSNFPHSEFAAAVFNSTSLRPRAIVLGGRDKDGDILNGCWNFEYLPANDSLRVQDYAVGRAMSKISATAVVWYDNKLMRFGGIDEAGRLDSTIYVSNNEGLSWSIADTASIKLPDGYGKRQKISAVAYDKDIFLFGGHTADATKADLWQGRINSADWTK